MSCVRYHTMQLLLTSTGYKIISMQHADCQTHFRREGITRSGCAYHAAEARCLLILVYMLWYDTSITHLLENICTKCFFSGGRHQHGVSSVCVGHIFNVCHIVTRAPRSHHKEDPHSTRILPKLLLPPEVIVLGWPARSKALASHYTPSPSPGKQTEDDPSHRQDFCVMKKPSLPQSHDSLECLSAHLDRSLHDKMQHALALKSGCR